MLPGYGNQTPRACGGRPRAGDSTLDQTTDRTAPCAPFDPTWDCQTRREHFARAPGCAATKNGPVAQIGTPRTGGGHFGPRRPHISWWRRRCPRANVSRCAFRRRTILSNGRNDSGRRGTDILAAKTGRPSGAASRSNCSDPGRADSGTPPARAIRGHVQMPVFFARVAGTP